MRIIGLEYSFLTRGLDIYVSGCKGPHCSGCHNPETHSFRVGKTYNNDVFDQICRKINDFPTMIDRIFIFGGEPLDQKLSDLIGMLRDLKTLNMPIWLFTKYDLNEVPVEVLSYIDYIKCGRYLEELKTKENYHFGINLATSNQKIYKISDILGKKVA